MKNDKIPGIACLALFFCSCGNPPEQKADTVISRPDSADRSWVIGPFNKADSLNPVLVPGNAVFTCPVRKEPVKWEEKDVFNPAMVVRNGKVFMLYRAQDKTGKPDGTSRIGIAESSDGLHFTRKPAPVFYPDNDAQKKYEWQGGCEDPRIVEDSSGRYIMTYTAFDGTLARLMVATSTDLEHWTKYGPAFSDAYQGKYRDLWSKSGSIISNYKDGKIIAARIKGKYWMYWGDQNIWIATSDDLIHWTPVEMSAGEQPPIELRGQAKQMPQLKIVVPTRNKKFDSDLVECGPPAMITEKGILLIYNSRNIPSIGDSSLPEGTYAAGQVLFSLDDPSKIISRTENYFFKPDKPYEISGQVNNVCFLEGLVQFKGQWMLYYGTADSKIAVAVSR